MKVKITIGIVSMIMLLFVGCSGHSAKPSTGAGLRDMSGNPIYIKNDGTYMINGQKYTIPGNNMQQQSMIRKQNILIAQENQSSGGSSAAAAIDRQTKEMKRANADAEYYRNINNADQQAIRQYNRDSYNLMRMGY